MNQTRLQRPVSCRSVNSEIYTVGTLVLLEEGTCCDRAAKQWLTRFFEDPPTVYRVPNFAEGASAASRLKDAVLLLPHVHSLCSELTVSAYWTVLEDLVLSVANPPLFLARRRTARDHGPRVACAAIHPLRALLKGIEELCAVDFVDTDSTQSAARLAAAGERCDYCVTNENGVLEYDLEPVQELKRMTIWWMPFRWIGPRDPLQPAG